MSDETRAGHVKLARKAFTTDAWWLKRRKFSMWEAWVDMIQLAQWRPRKLVSTKFGTVNLERGEFVLSIRAMAKRWNWSVRSVRTFTKSCEFCARISTQRETPAGTVYLIVNYDRYQSTLSEIDTATDTGPTQDRHRTDTRTSSKAVKQTTKAVKAPSGANTHPVWVSPLSVFWNAEVGRLGDASIARDCAAIVASHGPERVLRAVKLYVAHQKSTNRGMSWKWFVDSRMTWLERAATPLDVIDGEMSDTLELLTRPARMVSA